MAGSAALPLGLSIAAGAAPDRFLLVWQQEADGGTDLRGMLLAPPHDGGTVGPFDVCSVPGFQLNPGIARRRGDFLVVWNDSRNFLADNGAYTEIYGARVSDLGGVLEPNGAAVSASDGGMAQKFVPQAACHGDSCVVAWSQRLTPSWKILTHRLGERSISASDAGEHEAFFGLAQPQFLPVIVAVDGGYPVAWSTDVSAGHATDLAMLDERGLQSSGPLRRMVPGATVAFRPALTLTSGRPWMAWLASPDGGGDHVFAGEPGGPTFILPPASGTTFDHLAATWDGERVWFAHSVLPTQGGASHLALYQLDDAGSPALFHQVMNAGSPGLTSDGAGVVLFAWAEWPNGAVHYRFVRRASVDAGQPDGGAADAGPPDGGATDAGENDGGRDEQLPLRRLEVACGCSALDWPWPPMVLTLLLLGPRRQRGSRRPDA